MRRHLTISCLLGAALLMPACETAAVAVATPIVVQKRHLNLTNASYAAIETLVGQTNQKMDPLRPLIVQNLEEIIEQPAPDALTLQKTIHENPELIKVMQEQMSSRLMQLGYRVLDHHAPPATDRAPYIVFGTFHIDYGNLIQHGGHMQVALQMRDPVNDRIISTHTYAVPVTDEVRRYLAGGNVLMPKFVRD